MKYPYELFTGDTAQDKELYLALMKRFHPDLNGEDERFIEVSSKINKLYDEIVKGRIEGFLECPGIVKFKSKDNKIYSMKYKIKHQIEIGCCYVGNESVLYIIDEEYDELAINAIKRINGLKYADDNMKHEFQKYMPEIKFNTKLINGKRALAFKKEKELYSLRDILGYFKGSLDGRTVMWIMSSLYNICCFLNYNGVNHNGITVDNYYVSFNNHYGALLGGWWYSALENEKMMGVSSELYDLMDRKTKESKRSTYVLDLEGVRLIGRTLLGDPNGINLLSDKTLPEPLKRWLREISNDNPFDEYKKWSEVIDKSYGRRSFCRVEISDDFYKKLGGL